MQKLNRLHDKNPFKVPENYFEEVNRKIISATAGHDSVTRDPGLYNRFKPYLLIAAAVTGFIIISYTAVKILIPERINLPSTELSFGEFNYSDLDDIDLTAIEESSASLVFSDEGLNLKKTDIIEYLLQDNIEISDIYEQL